MKKFYLALFLVSHYLCAQDSGGDDRDPVARINYANAFNLSKIQKKYESVLSNLACAKNIFGDKKDDNLTIHNDQSDYLLITSSNLDDDVDNKKLQQQFKLYQEECIKHLSSERRTILFRPAKESLIMMALMGTASGAILLAAGPDSFGGSFGIFASMFNSVFYLRDIIRASYNWCYTPPHPVDDLEIDYVKNQCFIPKAIWPKIMQKFMMARSNPFEQQDALHFIEFALGLTVFKEKNVLPRADSAELNNFLKKKIDNFFDDYENVDDKTKHVLKVNVKRFLEQLHGANIAPRYLYLVGPGGIGKTHFARQLVSWIEDFFPEATHLLEINITSPDELEGSATNPGAFLRVLRNQCQAKKNGTIVFIDEANWLNDKAFEASAKRVFNGNQTTLSTKYFGSGQDGSGIFLDMPPMLIILAGNNDVDEAALKSRFDSISFPHPTKKALKKHAVDLVVTNSTAKKIVGVLDDETLTEQYENELETVIRDMNNFREIQSIVPTFINKLEEQAYDNL